MNAYWDLYYAYRDLEARRRIMEKVLASWRRQKARAGDDEDDVGAKEALVREQYYQLKLDVNNSISGRLVQGTQNRNGSPGGTLRGVAGVQVAERRLRLLIGLPINDGSLLRPTDEPLMAEYVFDWDSSYVEALAGRPELKRQRLRIKRRQMELLAAENFLNPRLDAFGRYRFRGFGKDLSREGNQHGSESASALGNLATGDQQEAGRSPWNGHRAEQTPSLSRRDPVCAVERARELWDHSARGARHGHSGVVVASRRHGPRGRCG